MKAYFNVYEHDLWGNDEDGYQVNDSFCINRAVEVELVEVTYNVGTPRAFVDYDFPENWRELFAILPDVELGDGELEYSIDLVKDDVLIGELVRVR